MCRGYRYWTGSLCVDLQDSAATKELLHNGPLLFDDFDAARFVPKTKKGQISLE